MASIAPFSGWNRAKKMALILDISALAGRLLFRGTSYHRLPGTLDGFRAGQRWSEQEID
jgi:hypothetical protein